MIDLLRLQEKAEKASKPDVSFDQDCWNKAMLNNACSPETILSLCSELSVVRRKLDAVLNRESASQARYDAKLDQLEAELSAARERETPEQAFERGQIIAHERITKHNPTVFLYGTKPYFPPTGGTH